VGEIRMDWLLVSSGYMLLIMMWLLLFPID